MIDSDLDSIKIRVQSPPDPLMETKRLVERWIYYSGDKDPYQKSEKEYTLLLKKYLKKATELNELLKSI